MSHKLLRGHRAALQLQDLDFQQWFLTFIVHQTHWGISKKTTPPEILV